MGARAYDASIGRFISVDPVIDFTDSQQMHGYAYANNSPVTFSDPDGLYYDYAADYIRQYNRRKNAAANALKNSQSKARYEAAKAGYTLTYPSSPPTYIPNFNSRGGWYYGAPSMSVSAKGSSYAAVQQRNPYSGPSRNPRDEAVSNARSEQSGWEAFASWARPKGDAFASFWNEHGGVISAIGLVGCIAISAGLCAGVGVAVALANFVARGSEIGYFTSRNAGGLIFDLSLTALGGMAGLGRAAFKLKPWLASPFSRDWTNVAGKAIPSVLGRTGRFRHSVSPVNFKETAKNMGANAVVSGLGFSVNYGLSLLHG